jgi:hypothetical protein
MRKRHGRVTHAARKHRSAAGKLEGGFREHRDQCDGANPTCERLTVPQQRCREQTEQGAIETGESAIGRELRLTQRHRARDRRSGEGERRGRPRTRLAFAQRAENQQHAEVPREMVRVKMSKVRRKESPPFAGGERGSVELKRFGCAGEHLHDQREGGGGERQEGELWDFHYAGWPCG